VSIARGGTTMWRAWVGFNFSHSLGAVLFGGWCIWAGIVLGTTTVSAWILVLFVAIAFVYLCLSVLYWFRMPTAGIAVATVCLLAACLLYAAAGA
jgi:hypothetical protein